MQRYALILEDCPSSSRFVSKMFARIGFSVTCKRNKEDIIDCAKYRAWDILVLDQIVADDNIFEHFRDFKAVFPDTPIAIVGADREPCVGAGREPLRRERQLNVEFILKKPLDLSDVRKIAEQLDFDKRRRRIEIESSYVYIL